MADGCSALVFKKTYTLMVCDVPLFRSSSSLVEVLHEKQSNIHFDSQLPDFWVVMNIINSMALHVCLPH